MSAGEPRRPGQDRRGRHDGEPGLGQALALTGFLAATKVAETATGIVLSAAGVLSGSNAPSAHADAAPGGE